MIRCKHESFDDTTRCDDKRAARAQRTLSMRSIDNLKDGKMAEDEELSGSVDLREIVEIGKCQNFFKNYNGKDIKRERGEKGVWGCLTPFTLIRHIRAQNVRRGYIPRRQRRLRIYWRVTT